VNEKTRMNFIKGFPFIDRQPNIWGLQQGYYSLFMQNFSYCCCKAGFYLFEHY
jgi:hypothetical protein